MTDCVFCNIANKTIDKELLYEDELIVAFHDILPKAPVHLQIIPKEHIISVNHLEEHHKQLIGNMVFVAKGLAKQQGIDESGYKLIFNAGRDGGQVIPHLHLYLLGGKPLEE